MSTDVLPNRFRRRIRDDTVTVSIQFLLYGTALVTVLWHLYYAYLIPIDRTKHSNIHLGLLLSIYFLTRLEVDDNGDLLKRNLLPLFLLAATVVTTVYVHLNFSRWLNEARGLLIYSQLDLVVGFTAIVLVMYVTWRAYGRLLGGVTVAAFIYGYAGPLFPGILNHSGISLERLIFMNSVALNGVYGYILGVVSTWVAIFIFFAGIVEAYGGIDYVMERAQVLVNRTQTGIVQVAVVSSMIMGSITGASMANVATTGSFTIPLMKENGVPSKYAAAIESVASTGGQVLPPVMASAAFIMADIIGVPYFEVIRGAVLPAILFYVSVVLVVHLMTLRFGWLDHDSGATTLADTSESDGSTLRSVASTLFEGSPYTVSLLVIIYTLVVLRYDPMLAGMYAILAVVGLAAARSIANVGLSASAVTASGTDFLEGCRIGVEKMAPITAVCASLGIVIRIVTATGFPQKFSVQMVSLAGGVFVLVLVLAMLVAIVFGLGMPTVAAYIVVSILIAPTLVELGIGNLTAHMFVLYFAVLSTLTPPVALSVAVGAGIADATFWDSAKSAIRLGLFAFLLPYVFVTNSELIYWEGATTAVVFGLTALGFVALAISLTGHDGRNRVTYPEQALYGLMSLGILFYAPYQLPLVGITIAVWLLLGRDGVRRTVHLS